MKLKITCTTLLIGMAAALLVGCVNQPLVNMQNEPIPSSLNGGKIPMADIADAMIKADASRGWVMQQFEPGQINANLNYKGYDVRTLITFNQDAYSIKYVSSQGLGYDGYTINRGYNRWIEALCSSIDKELSAKLPK